MDPLTLALISQGVSWAIKIAMETGNTPTPEEVQAHLLSSIDEAQIASDKLNQAAKAALAAQRGALPGDSNPAL